MYRVSKLPEPGSSHGEHPGDADSCYAGRWSARIDTPSGLGMVLDQPSRAALARDDSQVHRSDLFRVNPVPGSRLVRSSAVRCGLLLIDCRLLSFGVGCCRGFR